MREEEEDWWCFHKEEMGERCVIYGGVGGEG